MEEAVAPFELTRVFEDGSRLIDSAKHLTVQQTNELKNLTPQVPFTSL